MSEATEADMEVALAEFTDYFVKNYPGPDTVIYDPQWHAPKLFNAAKAAIRRADTQPNAAQAGSRVLPPHDRDTLGRVVREAWVRWAESQPNPKASWLLSYDKLPEADKEADRQIGEAVILWASHEDMVRAAPVRRTGQWAWYASRDGEYYGIGPCQTREEAIEISEKEELGYGCDAEGKSELTFYIVEARIDPIMVSDFMGIDTLLEDAEDNAADSDLCDWDDPPHFPCTKDQELDLHISVKAAIDAWQIRHNLKYKFQTFSASRNEELVVIHLNGSAA